MRKLPVMALFAILSAACSDGSRLEGTTAPVDLDGDGYDTPADCDDDDSDVNPGAAEVCDTVDNDCDGTVDNDDAVDATTWYADQDGDGFGDPADSATACEAPTDRVANSDDCDDTSELAYTGAVEVCDAVDNDCDGAVDNDDAVDATTWYADQDGDGFGDPADSATACEAPTDRVANSDDCDDTSELAYTGAAEVCDTVDNDCDGTVDNDDAVDATTWYADQDGDGFGDPADSATACEAPTDRVANSDDCDVTSELAYTGAAEVCDAVDNDCDGTVDNDDAVDATTWYADQDGDGFGDPADSATACEPASNQVDNPDDCDDADGEISDNLASYAGGLLVSVSQDLELESCTVWDNTATVEGGGVFVVGLFLGTTLITDSTLTSTGSNWGVGTTDNKPEDVFIDSWGTAYDYGSSADFTCTVSAGGCY